MSITAKKYLLVILSLLLVAELGFLGIMHFRNDIDESLPVTEAPATKAPTDVPTEESTATPTEVPTEPPTEPTTEPIPNCVNAVVQVDDAPAILMLLNRDDRVDVVGEHDDNHYVIKTEQGYGLVEKQLLRMAEEPGYDVWTGYAYPDAEVHDDYQLIGEPIKLLKRNTKVDVLDELKYCYIVEVEDSIGFMKKSEVSKKRIQSSGGNTSGADGGDISLGSGGIVTLSVIAQTGDVIGQAVVLADGAQVILGYFKQGEAVPVVTDEGFAPIWEGYYTLYLGEFYAYLPKNLALMEEQEAYAQWNGYSRSKAEVYNHYLLLGEGTKLKTNTSVTVLWDGGDFYMVSVAGEIGYMDASMVGEKRVSTGGSGNSGGDWTPPVM